MTPGRPDRRVVNRRLMALRRAVAILRRHAGCTPEELRSDIDRRWAIEHGLQLSAQAALDVATHLGSALGYDPATYGSSIDCLVEADVLPPNTDRKDRSECPKSDSLSRFRTLATDSPDSERDGSVSAEKRGGKNIPSIVVPPGRLQMDEYFLVPATPDQVYDRSSLDTLGREIGGADGIRTHDPLNAIQVLFQLSYSPTLKSSETGL